VQKILDGLKVVHQRRPWAEQNRNRLAGNRRITDRAPAANDGLANEIITDTPVEIQEVHSLDQTINLVYQDQQATGVPAEPDANGEMVLDEDELEAVDETEQQEDPESDEIDLDPTMVRTCRHFAVCYRNFSYSLLFRNNTMLYLFLGQTFQQNITTLPIYHF
jgi:hypothetical protein